MNDISDSQAARIAVAKSIIVKAGATALGYFERFHTLSVEHKTSGQDTVSEADRNVETEIRTALSAAFPEDGLWGEEHGRRDGASAYTWVIDPIDGTAAFLHGMPSWTVVIALLKGGETVAGLIFAPAEDKLFFAEAGKGAFCNDRPIRIDNATPLDGGLVVIGPGAPHFAAHVGGIITRLMAAGGMYMRFGSAARSLSMVASGNLLGFYEPALSSWDCLAGLLLVREAGGETEGFSKENDWSNRQPVLAVTPAAASELKAVIGPRGAV
ncbi:inositol monophosphatase [Martelella alba]|uniref:Inositol-1-monophosphatase n=1 Tax=Martelella alba TaxID=2590451 RepID=A0A506UFA9_9HYPH|nr:inositol monophosphatase [Martelella alba]TPW32216.1 inositol monophosphatase [Martelella alba]